RSSRGGCLFFRAEDGIRDRTVTGVQTCALPIYPAWSPDGKSLAYLSDESGEYALHIRDQGGQGEARKISLGNPPTFSYSPTWSRSEERRVGKECRRGRAS